MCIGVFSTKSYPSRVFERSKRGARGQARALANFSATLGKHFATITGCLAEMQVFQGGTCLALFKQLQ